MSAERFIERVRQMHPAIRILMASGMDEIQWLCRAARPDHFIQKPFITESFLAAVQFAMK